jgi:uncharacterized repeat protein (TIGR01451 family)
VTTNADLSLTKTDSPDPARVGEQVTYTLAVQNAGPSSAAAVTVTDTLPAGVTYESATTSQGSCSQAAGTVTCALGTLTNGAGATITVKIRPLSAGSITNQANVSSSASDPVSGNNSASAPTTVDPAVGYARPRGATPLRAALVPAFAQCTSPNDIHGPPLASPSCKPPVRASNYLTVGTPDANGPAANMIGFVKFDVMISSVPTPNDVQMQANITDVRCGTGVSACGTANAADGPDYTGQLEATYPLRITDRFSGTGGGVPATVSDTSFPVTIACGATANNTIGATCAVSTSANALVPGSVQTGSRAIWAMGQIRVNDGGPDGAISTAGNGVFATQGLFVP